MSRIKRMLVVDAYNVLNQWRGGVKGMSGTRLGEAREALIDAMQDYAGYTGQNVVLVFDGWQTERLTRTEEKRGNVTVVYTRKNETADSYIERLCDEYAEDIRLDLMELRVATSDRLEQLVALGRGAIRVSSREIIIEMDKTHSDHAPNRGVTARPAKAMLRDNMSEETRQKIDELIRLGKENAKPRRKKGNQ